MNTEQINKILGSVDKSIAPYFRGTYSSDKLHLAKSFIDYNKPNVICCNTASSHEKWGHWLLIYVSAGEVLFVDSFAKTPSFYGEDIGHFVDQLGVYKTSPFRLQSELSVVCGAYVCYFAHYLVKGYSLNAVYNNFSPKTYINNDISILKWLRVNYGLSMDMYDCTNNPSQSCTTMNNIMRQKIK